MRRSAALLLLTLTGGCGDAPPVAAPPSPVVHEATSRRRVGERPTAVDTERVSPGEPVPELESEVVAARSRALLRDLGDPVTREAGEVRLQALDDAGRIALLRHGLSLPDDLALEAAKRLSYHWLDAGESERFVALLLPHLFDEADDIDVEEMRSALGSSEIAAVLQEMREHEVVAGERLLLGALHRQLRAEHLPALVEMALSRDRWLAAQAFEEIAIVAMYTNRHRSDVARLFAGRAEAPEKTHDVPAELVVALRAIVADASIDDVRRSMFLSWALRWLRDCNDGGGGDRRFLQELIVTARTAPGLGVTDRENVQVCAVLGLAEKDLRWLRRDLEANPDAWTGDAALAVRIAVAADRGPPGEARSLAGAVPLALALLMEIDPREGERALFEALSGRKGHAALEFVNDVYSARFRSRLRWRRFARRRLRTPSDIRLDPALVLRLAVLYPEFEGRASVAPFLAQLAKPGALERAGEGLWEVLPSIEGDALREVLRGALAEGTAGDRAVAARLLARLRDRPSEHVLIDLALARHVDDAVVVAVAGWASSAGRARIREWLDTAELGSELETRAALGRLPRTVAASLAARLVDTATGDPGTLHAEQRAQREEVLRLLHDGDAVGALLLYHDVDVHAETDGIGLARDERVAQSLRTWAARRADGRAHWALGELALAGDSAARRQIEDVVQAGRYRWVDDASGDVLLLGGGGELSFWIEEAESNCCRAVAVKRVFEDALRLNASEEMCFPAGVGVTLAEWLRWRLDDRDWLLEEPHAQRSGLGRPDGVRALVWSDIADGYVPSLR